MKCGRCKKCFNTGRILVSYNIDAYEMPCTCLLGYIMEKELTDEEVNAEIDQMQLEMHGL